MQINEALRDLFSQAPKPLVIAIDGPAGSGKSTLAGEIARGFAGTYDIEVIHLFVAPDDIGGGVAFGVADV